MEGKILRVNDGLEDGRVVVQGCRKEVIDNEVQKWSSKLVLAVV